MSPGGDPWLERWLPLLAGRCTGAPILELGCGSGQDSAVLAAAGYPVVGEPKRFFDRAAIERLFAGGWRMISLEEMVVHRYAHPKSLWEAVVESAD